LIGFEKDFNFPFSFPFCCQTVVW